MAGERVLDLGSGAGTDSLIAAQMVGAYGHVTGIDMTPDMLAKARTAAAEMELRTPTSSRPRRSSCLSRTPVSMR